MQYNICIMEIWNYQPIQERTCATADKSKAHRTSCDLSNDLDFLLSLLDTDNFVHSCLRKEPPFIHTSFDYLMAINNNMSSLISPQDQTSLSGDILHFKWKSWWKSSTHFSGIFTHPVCLHIDAKHQMLFSPGCPYYRNSFLFKAETEVYWNDLTSQFSAPQAKTYERDQKLLDLLSSTYSIYSIKHTKLFESSLWLCLTKTWLRRFVVCFGFFNFLHTYILMCLQKKIWQIVNLTVDRHNSFTISVLCQK